MKKEFFILNYLNEGEGDNAPYVVTIAISDDIEKLREEMNKLVEEDCVQPDDENDEWDTKQNYKLHKSYLNERVLCHRKYTDLYARYIIQVADFV